MNEKDLDPVAVAHYKEHEAEVKGLSNGAKNSIAHCGGNVFSSCFYTATVISKIEIGEKMSYEGASTLRKRLMLLSSRVKLDAGLAEMLTVVRKYDGYFEPSASSYLEFLIKLSKEIEVPKELVTEVENSPAFASHDLDEDEPPEITLSPETVKKLKEYQEKIIQHEYAGKSIRDKVNDIRIAQYF